MEKSCETCKHNNKPWYSEVCNGCTKADSNYEVDLIGRRDAIEAVICHIWHMPNELYRLFNCENVIREVVEDAIERLPSIDRPTGHIVTNSVGMFQPTVFATCSECDIPIDPWDKYCRNCGAKMEGGEEE